MSVVAMETEEEDRTTPDGQYRHVFSDTQASLGVLSQGAHIDHLTTYECEYPPEATRRSVVYTCVVPSSKYLEVITESTFMEIPRLQQIGMQGLLDFLFDDNGETIVLGISSVRPYLWEQQTKDQILTAYKSYLREMASEALDMRNP